MKSVRRVLFWAMVIGLSLIFFAPLLFIFLTSFKTMDDVQTLPVQLLPREWTLANYTRILFEDKTSPVALWFWNSLWVATSHAILACLVASLAGYALARMHFRGKGVLFGVILSTMFLPGFIFLMPNFELMSKLAWLDSFQALIIPGLAGAFGVFFMRQFFINLPVELEESARIDGAGPFTTFFRIMLPNAKAGLSTLFILSFLGSWNDFIWPLFVMFSEDKMTLPVGLARLQGAYLADVPVIMAGACVAAIPVLIVYSIAQRHIIEGVANSGLKG